ncbi:hypothetical protein D3C76_1577500 [compost metagenome]
MAGQIFTGSHATQATAGTGEEAEDIGYRWQFVIQRAVIRLATVEGLQLGEGFRMLVNYVRQRQ